MTSSNNPNAGKGNIRAYQNIMEGLVHQEIYRQMQRLPDKLTRYIDASEVATFALNRLPPLYASSERGKEQQAKKGENTLKQDVATAVRQALAAVQRDPLRSSTPLADPKHIDPRYEDAEVALQDLVSLLRRSYLLDPEFTEVSWDMLKVVIAKALKKTAQRGIVDRNIEEVLTNWDHSNYTAPVFDWVDQQYRE